MTHPRLLFGIAATAAALGYSLLAPSPPTAPSRQNAEASPIVSPRSRPGPAPALRDRPRGLNAGVGAAPTRARRGPPVDLPRRELRGALGEAGGAVPGGTTVFDDEIPGVARLDPDLLGALRRAATDAAKDGVEFLVNSGWRSPEYQEQLLREAVAEFGSEEEAARWVATPTTSAHVSGSAVDLGPFDAIAWLSAHGAAYGLCQIYRNESWHFELRLQAIDQGCPPMYADPTHDPRMQQPAWPAPATGRSASSSMSGRAARRATASPRRADAGSARALRANVTI